MAVAVALHAAESERCAAGERGNAASGSDEFAVLRL